MTNLEKKLNRYKIKQEIMSWKAFAFREHTSKKALNTSIINTINNSLGAIYRQSIPGCIFELYVEIRYYSKNITHE